MAAENYTAKNGPMAASDATQSVSLFCGMLAGSLLTSFFAGHPTTPSPAIHARGPLFPGVCMHGERSCDSPLQDLQTDPLRLTAARLPEPRNKSLIHLLVKKMPEPRDISLSHMLVKNPWTCPHAEHGARAETLVPCTIHARALSLCTPQ
jgi:hypothetical protein